MTRIEMKNFLIEQGIENPSEELITAQLNLLNGEVSKEKAKTEKYKEDALKVSELQKQLDEINTANLSDIEKANKATEDANKRIAELEAQVRESNMRKDLADNGITGDFADRIVEGFKGGNLDVKALGELISEREKAAVSKFEKDSLDHTPNPDGSGTDEKESEKTEMDKAVEIATKSLAGGDKSSTDIINAYK